MIEIILSAIQESRTHSVKVFTVEDIAFIASFIPFHIKKKELEKLLDENYDRVYYHQENGNYEITLHQDYRL